jgi:ferrous iron transport protein A
MDSRLDRWPLHTRALITGLQPASDAQERAIVLRLLEIGFLPGEAVRVVARGGLGGDPIAVRVGQATFALRRREASMVQVQQEASP